MLRIFVLSFLAIGLALGEEDGHFATVVGGIVGGSLVFFLTLPSTPIPESVLASAPTSGKYSLYDVKANWYKAFLFCQQIGKQLATFNNAEDYNTLIKLMREVDAEKLSSKFWIAASDLAEYGKYSWFSNGQSVTYAKWWDNNPSHTVNNGEMERCIEISAQHHFELNDNRCSQEYSIACENK